MMLGQGRAPCFPVHQKKSSRLTSMLGRNHTLSKASSVMALQAQDLLDSKDSSLATTASLSTHSSSSRSSSSSETTLTSHPIKSCLKHSTQLESLEHIYGAETTSRRSSQQEQERTACIPAGTAEAPETITITTSNNKPSSIRWSTVQIHLHGIILGDNPAVSHGPPVTIEWDSFESTELSLHHYETSRVAPLRRDRELVLPLALRHDMIERSDDPTVGHREVLVAIYETDQIRRRRARTAQHVELHQKVKDRFLRSFLRGKTTTITTTTTKDAATD